MTPAAPASAADALAQILQDLLPSVLLAAASVRALHSRWRALQASLLALQSSLVSAPASAPSHPLFADLVAALLPALRSLHALSVRCQDPGLPGGRLRLKSDLDMVASSLSLLLHDLSLLLRSGLLSVDSELSIPTDIVLQVPASAAPHADKSLFVRDAFARLQIGSLDLKLTQTGRADVARTRRGGGTYALWQQQRHARRSRDGGGDRERGRGGTRAGDGGGGTKGVEAAEQSGARDWRR